MLAKLTTSNRRQTPQIYESVAKALLFWVDNMLSEIVNTDKLSLTDVALLRSLLQRLLRVLLVPSITSSFAAL